MKVVWPPLALQKLGDAAEFIALDNPSVAEKWVFEAQRSAIISNKTFLRCFKAQTSSGSVVKFVCNRIALCLSKCRHRGAL